MAPTASASASATAAPTHKTGFDVLNEGLEVAPLVVTDPSNAATDTSATPQPTADPGKAPASADTNYASQGSGNADTDAVDESESDAPPTRAPSAPVQNPDELGPDNAGSLSGTRQGAVVTLIFPTSKVTEGDWVAVFVYPGATTAGWVQVDADNSVSIDISALGPGSYKIAVGDRDSQLLGWAQLEIAETARGESADDTGITLIAGEDLMGDPSGSTDDWKLIGAGVLLALGLVTVGLLIRPALNGVRTRASRR
ncbi:hypothetical protein [Actinomyces sp. MRS3W]|uniref:hypothetical protein n=1 Tax=Actinomyces sp. MRS3W TaxID=2800796 RepID=UPI003967AD03